MWPCPPSGPEWAKPKPSDQAPFSSVPGAAGLADHGDHETLPSSEDKADRIVLENLSASGQCSSLQYDLKVISYQVSQPQFPSL